MTILHAGTWIGFGNGTEPLFKVGTASLDYECELRVDLAAEGMSRATVLAALRAIEGAILQQPEFFS